MSYSRVCKHYLGVSPTLRRNGGIVNHRAKSLQELRRADAGITDLASPEPEPAGYCFWCQPAFFLASLPELLGKIQMGLGNFALAGDADMSFQRLPGLVK